MSSCGSVYSGKNPPSVTNGEIDLTGWDFQKDGPVKLDGDWLFKWGEFIDPVNWPEVQEGLKHSLTVPGRWPELDNPAEPSEKLPGIGYATYALKIVGIKNPREVAIARFDNWSTGQFFILQADGKLLNEVKIGQVATSKENEIPVNNQRMVLPLAAQPVVQAKEEIFLIMHTSNHFGPLGGLWYSIELGNFDKLKKQRDQVIQINALMVGITLVISLYLLIFFYQHRKDYPALYFALFCASLAIIDFAGGFAQAAGIGYSYSGASWFLKVSFLGSYVGYPALLFYIHHFLDTSYFKNFKLAALAVGMLLSLLFLFSEPLFYLRIEVLLVHYVYLFTILSGTCIGLFIAIKGRREFATLLFVSLSLYIFGFINDVLQVQGVLNTPRIASYTATLFIISQAAIISFKNARAHINAENLAADLQNEIQEKQDLQSSNQELEARHVKYGKLIGDLTQEYAQAEQKLEEAKKEQVKVTQELNDASRQLIQSEKLSSLGAMVSGIAHDINNPLNFIETARFQEEEKLSQFKDHLLELVPEGEEGDEFRADLEQRFNTFRKLNEQIKLGVTRVTEISKSMRNASRSDVNKTYRVNILEVIAEAIIITGNKVKQFELTQKLPEEAFATCNRSQLGQVIMNFLSNAADALAEYHAEFSTHSGRIHIEVSINNQNENDPELSLVEISVADNGGGIPVESRGEVLNAFFTTKAVGLGTGLGLAICDKIAKDHDGKILIQDGLENGQGGVGAKFTFEFNG